MDPRPDGLDDWMDSRAEEAREAQDAEIRAEDARIMRELEAREERIAHWSRRPAPADEPEHYT